MAVSFPLAFVRDIRYRRDLYQRNPEMRKNPSMLSAHSFLFQSVTEPIFV